MFLTQLDLLFLTEVILMVCISIIGGLIAYKVYNGYFSKFSKEYEIASKKALAKEYLNGLYIVILFFVEDANSIFNNVKSSEDPTLKLKKWFYVVKRLYEVIPGDYGVYLTEEDLVNHIQSIYANKISDDTYWIRTTKDV